ncbi:hypothetical protein [Candidatus Nanohalococcus occultus]|uniref:Uncharacterized protein n=1 Tax=Candidatus Nanohalococcus occultus TaxID=2978047 RepID=A0ABY8CDC0_9ARCH|nr:hypothetical protein SVXNc_0186 [Candidatus Nanohaloarchaeota archaeon SVXNc]
MSYLDTKYQLPEENEIEDSELVPYLDENGNEWYLDPEGKTAKRPDMSRNKTTWDKIRNKFL